MDMEEIMKETRYRLGRRPRKEPQKEHGTGRERAAQYKVYKHMVRIRGGPRKDGVTEANIKEWFKWEGAAIINKCQVALTVPCYLIV